MIILNRPHTDPYFNIAAEEYLLKSATHDYFMLWVNEPSAIVGKHQNAFAEINHRYVKVNDIPVVRRISGGGTVFHDPGNINFSFIRQGEQSGLVDFHRFMQPVIDFLNAKGIPAKFEGKNDIRVNGLKVSGNAEHVFKNRVLHHGTLLFSSRLSELNQAIKGQEQFFQDKGVRSIRSKVSNISDFLSEPVTIEQFKEELLAFIKSSHPHIVEENLSKRDISSINQLVVGKYKTWEWNYGYSPRFSFEKEIMIEKTRVFVNIQVKNGIITQLRLESDELVNINEQAFIGRKFSQQGLNQLYLKSKFSQYFTEKQYELLVDKMLH